MFIYDRKLSYCYFRDIENVDKSIYNFVGKQFQPYLKKIKRYQEKHYAAIIFVLCNLWEELAHIPPEHGGYSMWEEAELSPFIAPTRTTQGGCNFLCDGVTFSSVVLWKVMEESSLSKLYVIHRGKFLNDKRLPARLIPRWTVIKILRDEYVIFSNKSDYYNKWKLTLSSSSSDTILNKICSDLVEIKQKIPNRDRRKKGKIASLPLADLMDDEEVTSSAAFLTRLRAYTASILLSLSSLSEVTENRLREVEIEFSSTELGKKVVPCFHSFVMENQISRRNIELRKFEGCPFPLKRVFHLQEDGGLSWGRIYGFPSDFLTRWQKLLLQIDGKPTIQIDVKSCIPQIACMLFSDEDNTQDFYSFPSLMKYGIDRDTIKSMFMSLCNSISIKKWISTQKFHNKQNCNVDNILSISDYYDIINEIIVNKPFMKHIICNPVQYKKLIKQESDYMISCMKDIMKNKIPFLYNFDCFIVQYDNYTINSVLDIMKAQSLYRWNKKINVEKNEYFINQNESFINDDGIVVNF